VIDAGTTFVTRPSAFLVETFRSFVRNSFKSYFMFWRQFWM